MERVARGRGAGASMLRDNAECHTWELRRSFLVCLFVVVCYINFTEAVYSLWDWPRQRPFPFSCTIDVFLLFDY